MSDQTPPSEAKRLRVALAAEFKRAGMGQAPKAEDPLELMLAQRLQDKAWEAEQQAGAKRTGTQMTMDAIPSIGRFLNSAVRGIPSAVLSGLAGEESAEPGTPLFPGMMGPLGVAMQIQALGTRVLDADRTVDNALRSRAERLITRMGEVDRSLRDQMSVVSRQDERLAGQDSAINEAANAAQRAERVAAGRNETLAAAQELGENIVDAAGNLIDHPTYLANQAVGQLPTLALGPAGRVLGGVSTSGRAAAAMAAAQTPAREALRRGGMAAAAARLEQRAFQEAMDEMRDTAVKRYVAAGGTAMEGSAMYAQGAEGIMTADMAALAQKYPGVQEQIDSGMSDSAIRQRLVNEVVVPGVLAMAPLSYGLMRASTGVELDPLALRAGTIGAIPAAARNVAGEIMEESVQGGASTFIANVADARRSGDENADLLAGVGTAIGESIPVSAAFSGGLAAPGLVGQVVTDAVASAGEVLPDVAGFVGKAFESRAAAVKARQQEQTADDTAARTEHLDTTETTLRQASPEVSTALNESAGMLDDELRSLVQAGEQEGPISVPTVSKQLDVLKTRSDELSPEQRRTLTNSLQSTGRKLQSALNAALQLTEEEQDMMTPEQHEALNQVSTLLEDPEMQSLLAEEDTPEQTAANTKLVEEIENATEEVAPAKMAELQEVSYRAPEKLTEKAAEQLVLFHKKRIEETQDPELKKQIELDLRYTEAVRDTGKILSQYAAEQKALDESIGVGNSGVTADMVTKRVRIEGFNNERSLKEYRADVLKALATGNKKEAASVMNQLQEFAVKFSQKARDFDTAVHDAYKTGNDDIIDKGITMPYRRLRNDGSLSQDSAWIIPRHSGLVDRIFVDARSTVNQFNRLVRALPELGLDELPLVGTPAFRAVKKRHDAKNPPKQKESSNAVAASGDGGSNTADRGGSVAEQASVPEQAADAQEQEEAATEVPGAGTAPVEEVPAVDDTPPWDVNDTRFVPQKDDPPTPPETSNSPSSDEAPFAVGKEAELEDRVNKRFRKKGRGYRAFGTKNMAILTKLSKMIQERLGIGLDSGIVDQWGRLIAPSSTVGGTTTSFKDGTTVVAINVDQMSEPNKEAGDRTAGDRRARTVAHELSHALNNKFWFETGTFASSHSAFQPGGVVWNEMLAAMGNHPRLAKWFGYVIDANQAPKELFAQIGALMVRTPASAQEYFPNGTQLFREAVAALTGQTAEQLVPAAVEQPAAAAAAAAEGSNRDGVSDVDTSPAAPVTDEESAVQADSEERAAATQPRRAGKSRFTEQQARAMSDETLDARINEIEEAREERGDTPNDLATLSVLVEELERREDQVTEVARIEAALDRPPIKRGATLDDALEMSNEEYLAAINPNDQPTSESEIEGMLDELSEENQEDLLDAVSRADYVTERNGIVYKRNGNIIYAQDGDRVVGQLASISTGTTSAVLPEYQGRGIGTQLVKELLRTNPFAPAGSLSDGGQRARLRALQELREERDGVVPEEDPTSTEAPEVTLEQRYPGLRADVLRGEKLENASTEEKLMSKNRLLSGFIFNSQGSGLFARMTDPVKKMITALKSDNPTEAVLELLPSTQRNTAVTEEQAETLRWLFEERLPLRVQQLQQRIQDKMSRVNSKGKSVLGELIKGNLVNWHRDGRLSLMATRWGLSRDTREPKIIFQPEIAQAIVLAGYQWMLEMQENPMTLDKKARDRLFPKGTTAEIEHALRTYPRAVESVERLSSMINQILGMKAKNNLPRPYDKGIPHALALEVVSLMLDEKMLRLVRVQQEPGSLVYLRFFDVTEDVEVPEVSVLLKNLGNSSTLGRFLDPGRTSLISVGKPIEQVRKKVQGTKQDVSKEQQKGLEQAQKQEHRINLHWLKDISQIGLDNIMKLRGVVQLSNDDRKSMNKEHYRSVMSSNRAVISAYNASWSVYQEAVAYAKKNGMAVKDVPLHHSWRVIGPMRHMVNEGHNAQGNKDVRELISPHQGILDLTDEEQLTIFKLALAQAFGIKTEKQKHGAAIAAVMEKLKAPEMKQVIDLWVKLQDEAGKERRVELGNQITEAIQKIYGDKTISARELNALSHYARYLRAKKAGNLKEFENQLAIEADGKTDGMFNAMMHFGLDQMNGHMVSQLRKSGLFINQSIGTLNDAGDQGDLYLNVTTEVTKNLRDIISVSSGLELKDYKAAVHLLTAVGEMGYESNDLNKLAQELVVERNLGKEPTTQKVYGAGMFAVMRNKASAIISYTYREMSAALAENREIDPLLVATLTHLLGQEEVKGEIKSVPVRDFGRRAGYANFAFTAEEVNLLAASLNRTVGKELEAVLNVEMAPVFRGFDMMFMVAGIQSIKLRRAFVEASKARRQELIDKGEMLITEELSEEELSKVIQGLKELNPAYRTQIGTLIDISTKEEGDDLMVETRSPTTGEIIPVKVEIAPATGGSITMPFSTYEPTYAGVRPAALTTQGAGDAAMMDRFLQLLREAGYTDTAGTFNVFDGLEMGLKNAIELSRMVNQASWEMLQHDMFGQYENALSNLGEFDFNSLTQQELADAFNKPYLADNPKAAWEFAAQKNAEFEDIKEQMPYKAARIRAMKQAIGEQSVSNDHMATLAASYRINGGVLDKNMLDDDIALLLNLRADELMEQHQVTDTAAESEALKQGVEDVLGKDNPREARTMDKQQLKALIEKTPFKSKVHAFIYNQLFDKLPSTMTVHWGSAPALQKRKEEIFGSKAASVMGTGREPGMMIGDQVFLSGFSEETLVHELLHVVAQDLLNKFYTLGGKGLTPEQRTAALQLDRLTQEFVKLRDINYDHRLHRNALQDAQEAVNEQIKKGNTAGAVNEFLAWSLTNPGVSARLKTERAPKGIMKLAADAREFFRKLLGLPNNSAMNDFFSATLGAFSSLVQDADQVAPLYDAALFQRLADREPETDHSRFVESVRKRFEVMLASITPRPSMTLSQEQKLLLMPAEIARGQLRDNGLRLNDAEGLVFDTIHAVLSSDLPLDPVVLHGMSETYGQAMKQLTPEMLLSNPDTASAMDRAHAKMLLKTLNGEGVGKDSHNRSLVLANFFAAAQTYEPLRKALMSLEVPKAEKVKGNLDTKVRGWTTRIFNWVSNRAIGVGNARNQDSAIEGLLLRLEQAHNEAARAEQARRAPNAITRAIDAAENRVKESVGKLADKANAKLQSRQAAGDTTRAESIVAQIFDVAVNTARSDGEGIIQALLERNVPTAFMELASDAIGATASTESLYALLNKVKYVVATTRQRLREEVPQKVREFFSEPLTKEDGLLLMDTMARIDQQVFVGTYSVNQIVQMMNDDVSLGSVIQSEIQNLSVYAAEYEAEARSLAKALVHRKHASRYRNATAMAELLDYKKVSMTDAEHNRPILDRLVTLMAIQELSQGQREATARLMERDVAGTEKLLLALRHLAAVERNKNGSGVANYNGWKGYIPESRDPRSHVVLATPVQAKDLVKRGYRRVAAYEGDPRDPGSVGMAYYAIDHAGGPATYVQGVLQTVAPTAQGLNLESGATISPHAARMIQVVGGSFGMTKKLKASNFKDSLLSPVYDTDGEIIAYERVLDPVLLENHLKGDQDIAQSIGIWAGRQMEERMATGMNTRAVRELKKMYDEDLQGRSSYIDLATTKDPIYRDAWKSLPVSVQKQMLGAFDGKALVREDMIRNVVGYRSPSIGDIFTGLSRLPAPVQKQAHDVALAIFGQDAYRKLVAAERAWEGAVGTVKDIIIVRMGVVALGNILSNVIQLTAHGVPVLQIPRLLARKAQETEIYMRNEKRLAQLALEIRTARTKAEEAKYKQEAERLMQENQRLSIHPLILAGELPTIAEGLTEQDQYNSFNDLMKVVEKKVGALPAPMVTAAKYAVIARDTAVYQGLNRFIQFGDFTAKAVIYDQLIAQGMQKDKALARTSERFVNYNRNAGRTRDKLEQLGLIWFWNYKVRIQKIVLSTLRDNPLRFLMSSLGADLTGQDSLVTSSALGTNWGYSIGPGQMERALDGGLWFQLVD